MSLVRRSALVLLGLLGTSCADGGSSEGTPSVVVTTSVLGDVVKELVGDLAEVAVVMPRGADPHGFQASARQAAAMRDADLLVVNGGGFEEGLLDVVDAAADDGVRVHEALSTVDVLPVDDGHAHGDGEREHVDPHFFLDPARMADAARGIMDAVVEQLPASDAGAVRERTAAYVARLEALDAEISDLLAPIPAADRVLVTNHDVFAYFADRYRFEVLATVLPAGTGGAASAAELADLVEVLAERRVRSVFVDSSAPSSLASALAQDAGVEVVELFTESLGADGSGGETYLGMIRTNARRVLEALT